MSEEKKKETIMVEGLGEVELVHGPGKDKDGNPTPGVYAMTQKNLEKFYEEHGVPEAKKVFKAIDDARTAFVEAGVTFLKPHVLENKSDYELRAGQGDGACGRHVLTIDAEKDVRNVATGEVTKRYGVVGFQVKSKAPKKSDIITKIGEEVEACFKAEFGR
jgi:hypothetical protein